MSGQTKLRGTATYLLSLDLVRSSNASRNGGESHQGPAELNSSPTAVSIEWTVYDLRTDLVLSEQTLWANGFKNSSDSSGATARSLYHKRRWVFLARALAGFENEADFGGYSRTEEWSVSRP